MTYILEITENERAVLILACGRVYDMTLFDVKPAELAARLIHLSSNPAAPSLPPSSAASGTAASRGAQPSPGWWTVTPNGKAQNSATIEVTDAFELTVTPSAITKYGEGEKERLVAQFSKDGRSCKASCWASHRALWPRVLERVKQPSVFLVKEKSGYFNIVGVKA